MGAYRQLLEIQASLAASKCGNLRQHVDLQAEHWAEQLSTNLKT